MGVAEEGTGAGTGAGAGVGTGAGAGAGMVSFSGVDWLEGPDPDSLGTVGTVGPEGREADGEETGEPAGLSA